ncbi:zinc-binding dehydrogenase [Jatrophihabitans sp.]|uniref:zinc-binding dehydrogenase n=1 Tax=Jatrophihabitans sp. TaxID=1932789 RepID=UPI0030C751C7|nr:alcohol dehydrogenase [Jatrophihabitans sp.]
MITSRQMSWNGPDSTLRLVEAELAGPPPGGLLARVTLAGVCGTDAHRLAGQVRSPAHPIVFGHEAVGVIEAVGADLTSDWAGNPVGVGDRITWFPNASCYRCHACVVLQNNSMCTNKTWPEPAGTASAAGFQEVASLHRNVAFFRIPDGAPEEAIIAFGCGMPTAVTAVDKAGIITATETVVVQGSGPVGLSATLLARRTHARQVILIGAPADRLEWGKRLGADHVIDIGTTTPEERLAQVRDLTAGRGADVVIEAAGTLPAFSEGIRLLANGGRYVISGLYSGDKTVPINPVEINNRNLQLLGSFSTRPAQKYEGVLVTAQYADELQLADFVSHRFPLAEVRSAIESMASGAATKTVVVPS